MDINFHYYAVKYIALVAGFNSNEAEIIATTSQFVDDYIPESSLRVENTYIPSYARASLQVQKTETEEGAVTICPVQTGFSPEAALVHEWIRKNVVNPFHFISQDANMLPVPHYQTIHAKHGDGSRIDQICQLAVANFHSGFIHRFHSLVFLGAAIHVFADTYAHEFFNGNEDSQINDWHFEWTGDWKGVWKDGGAEQGFYSSLVPIGHAKLGNIPDLSCFEFKARRGNDLLVRSNFMFFPECAIEIGKYFRAILNAQDQSREIYQGVQSGCKYPIDRNRNVTAGILENHWQAILNQPVQFKYKKYVMYPINEIFYAYNWAAGLIRDMALRSSHQWQKIVPNHWISYRPTLEANWHFNWESHHNDWRNL